MGIIGQGPIVGIRSLSPSFARHPTRFPIVYQRLPIYHHGHDCPQDQSCNRHLKDQEIGRVFADKLTRDNGASIQEKISELIDPIERDSLPGNGRPRTVTL